MLRASHRFRERSAALADAAVFVAGAAALIYPITLAYVRYREATPFKFLASDAFYYLNVAHRSQSLAFFTYDGTHPTNGFHPLWEWLLTGLFRVFRLTQVSDQQLLLDYAVCGALAAIGVGFLAVSASRLINHRMLALVSIIPGWFELLLSRAMVSTVDPTEAAPWHMVNGMETSLSLLWFGMLVWLLFRRPSLHEWSLTRLVALSALFSLSILSRLDDVFLLVSFTAGAVLVTKARRPPWQTLLATGAIPVLVLSGYLAYNVATTHMLLPVSSSMKLDTGALVGNIRSSWQVLFPTLLLGQRLYFWDAVNWRVLQLLAPMAVAVVYVAYHFFVADADARDPERRFKRHILMILAGYVLTKGGYNLLFVGLFAQGHWYFPLSIASANLMLTFLAGRTLRWQRPEIAPEILPTLGLTLRRVGEFAMVSGIGLALAASDTSGRFFAVGCVAIPGLLIALRSDRILEMATNISNRTRRRLIGVAAAATTGSFLLMYGNAIVNQKENAHYADASFEFWKSRLRIADELARVSPAAKLFELDDGIMVYALELPTMSGFGLAIDAEAYPACRARGCIDVAYDRGYRVVSSVVYWGYLNEQRRDFRRPSGEHELIETLVGSRALIPPVGAERFEFKLLFSIDTGNYLVHFLEFHPKP